MVLWAAARIEIRSPVQAFGPLYKMVLAHHRVFSFAFVKP
jgi:hypothetical protein